MRLVIQRVNHASVTVEQEQIGAIDRGLLIFLGIADGDTEAMVDKYVKKLSGLRIFEDENGKTNLSLTDVGGAEREIGQALPEPVHRILQISCMSILRNDVQRPSER